MEIILILSILCMITGIAGCVLPGLPGVPLVFGGLLMQEIWVDTVDYPMWILIILGIITLLVSVLQYIIPIYGTKQFGASKYAVRGSVIGLILGIFTSILGPWGLLIGPFAGAVVGEYIFAKKNIQASMKAGFGAFLGIIASSVMELVVSFMMVAVFVYYLFQSGTFI